MKQVLPNVAWEDGDDIYLRDCSAFEAPVAVQDYGPLSTDESAVLEKLIYPERFIQCPRCREYARRTTLRVFPDACNHDWLDYSTIDWHS